jgi:WD40 repeat protein
VGHHSPGRAPASGVSAVAFAPNGQALATAGFLDGTVILWDVSSSAAPRRLGAPLTGHTGTVSAVAFAPHGHILATAGAEGAVLWDTTDPAAPRRLGAPLTGRSSGVFAVAFAPDGQTLATAGSDGMVAWEITNPAAPQQLSAPLTDVENQVAFAPRGYTPAMSGRNGTVALWDFTGLQWLRAHAKEHACAFTGGGLSQSEWAQYVSGLKYINVCGT